MTIKQNLAQIQQSIQHAVQQAKRPESAVK
ncbi:YggS family pyridoxal phosphate enzyme, partial [Pasteurella multocida]|nr:YggS family pyridoxal phosphate enzyme [Pasteurella multocida]